MEDFLEIEENVADEANVGNVQNKSRIAHKKLTRIFEEEENQIG